jgi:hypothetical protein
MKYSRNFEEFRRERYQKRPWDYPWNPFGFNRDTACGGTSDISAHLPLLEFLAKQCTYCVEFGVRDAYSTAALISGCKGLVTSIDISFSSAINKLLKMKHNGDLPCPWQFVQANTPDETLDFGYPQLLFIDTLHTYGQIKKELELHGNKPHKFLVFHDTYSQGANSLDVVGEVGIMPAIEEFMAENPQWKEIYRANFNHGLLVLERTT